MPAAPGVILYRSSRSAFGTVSHADRLSEQFRCSVGDSVFFQVLCNFFDQFVTHILSRHFATFEHECDFEFAAFVQKFDSVFDLGFVIVRIDVKPEFDFLDFLRRKILLLLIFQFLICFTLTVTAVTTTITVFTRLP